MKYIGACAVLGTVLCACGGGGSNSGTTGPTVAPVSAPLTKYAGAWNDVCQFHHQETVTVIPSSDGSSASLSDQIQYFANQDCTGGVVAIGTYSQPIATLKYSTTVSGASITLQDGTSISATVDTGTATGSNATISFAGSGVTSSVVNGQTVWTITYNGGSTQANISSVSGASPAGLLLLNNQLYILTKNGTGTNSYDASAPLTP